jgi:hypothetical protein
VGVDGLRYGTPKASPRTINNTATTAVPIGNIRRSENLNEGESHPFGNITANKAGVVPNPNNVINNALRIRLGCANAPANARYTKPHGNNPFSRPTPNCAAQRCERNKRFSPSFK